MVVGGGLVRRLPRHPVGWYLVGFALLLGVSELTDVVAWWVDGTSVAEVVGWLGAWIWVLAINLLSLALLHVPDGRLPTPRWRLVRALVVVGMIAGLALGAALWSRGRARDQVDPDVLVGDLRQVLASTVHPASVVVWLPVPAQSVGGATRFAVDHTHRRPGAT